MAVEQVYGGELAWYSEIDKGALKILEHRFPDVPNVGDVTAVDWSQVEPVDILTGGSPCQDLSHAGRRAGMTEGTRSNLWVAMREAIAQLRPRLVIWENVRGAASAQADSAVEPCPGCVGDGPGVHLRALGRVVGDLAELGYVGGVHGLRAAEVGAPHGRFRYFLAAHPQGDSWWLEHGNVGTAADPGTFGRDGWSDVLGSRREASERRQAGDNAGDGSRPLLPTPSCSDTNGAGQHGDGGLDLRTAVALMPTPRATDGTKGGPGQRGSSGDLMLPSAVALLPTPAVNDMGEGKTVERWDEWTADMQAKHGNGNGHGKSLAIEAQRLLGTPTVEMSIRSPEFASVGETPAEFAANYDGTWGDYAAAIARWESVLGRPAPAPTQTSSKGNPQLSPAFVEWLMGLPAGWVTDVPGITRNEALKALGNGVVPQQATEALRVMAGWQVAA